ncbi:MAG: alpha/beta hydrolase [Azoarcus sp.]|jgi:pimeloyl-ACP methyl ester carboxylesterase|nr:alpha/beta hydrolase [Azoarcus sp.]
MKAKTPIIFIHGAQQDQACWIAQRGGLASRGYRVLTPDLPGHGTRAGEAALPSIEALAQWVVALLEAEGVGQAHIVGHSMGSLVALECAACFPQRFRSATLIGAALPMLVSPVLLDMARENESEAMGIINQWSFSVAGQLGRGGMPGGWMPGLNRCIMARQKPGVLYVDLLACHAYGRPVESLSHINVPMLVIAGRQDKMTSLKAAYAITKALPHARLEVLQDCGHALMAERPGEVLDALRRFIGPPHRDAIPEA